MRKSRSNRRRKGYTFELFQEYLPWNDVIINHFSIHTQTFSFDSSSVGISSLRPTRRIRSRYLDDDRDISRSVSCGTRSRRNAAYIHYRGRIKLAETWLSAPSWDPGSRARRILRRKNALGAALVRVDSVDGVCARSWRDGNRVEWWLSVMLIVVHRRPPIVTSRSQGFFFIRGNKQRYTPSTWSVQRLLQWAERKRKRERKVFVENLVELEDDIRIDELDGLDFRWKLEKSDFRRSIESGVNRWKGFSCSVNWVAATKIVKVTSTVSRRAIFRLGGRNEKIARA